MTMIIITMMMTTIIIKKLLDKHLPLEIILKGLLHYLEYSEIFAFVLQYTCIYAER